MKNFPCNRSGKPRGGVSWLRVARRLRPDIEVLEDRTVPSLFPAQFNLASLDGDTGLALNGIANSDQAGYSVRGAGDVNGDGFNDLVIGAPYADAGGNNRGQVYVVFGRSSGLPATLNLSSLNGINGFTLNGIADYDYAGHSVSGAGDINGDGIDDLVIGAYDANAGGSLRGQAYVVFGRSTGFAATLDLSTLDGSTGFTLNGIADNDLAGWSVSGAGDVNGDGIDDLIIGAYQAAAGGSERGQAYVVFGRTTSFAATLDLSTLDGTNGFALNGSADDDHAGFAVSGAGDVNGDGIDELVIGAPQVGNNVGAAYVVFGRTTGFSATLDLSTLNGSTGFTLNGIANLDQAGRAVGGTGDLNGDGIDDLVIGAPFAEAGGSNRGQAYVVFGRTTSFPATLDASSLNGSTGFTLQGIADNDFAGIAVSGAGDINGDGIDDLAIGADYAEAGGSNRGQVYVIYGRGTGFAASLNLSSLNGSTGFTLHGVADGDRAGLSVSGAGDVNGDGIDDLAIGAPFANADGSDRGQGYLVFGRSNWIVAGTDANAIPLIKVFRTDGSLRFELLAYTEALAIGGVRVAVGDVTGDGQPDIITAPGKGIPTRIKVFDGRTHQQVGPGFLPYGSGYSKGALVAAGDVNGDGVAEIIVGPQVGPQPVRIFDATGGQLTEFFPYGGGYTGPVRVAAGDVSGSAAAEIVTMRGTLSSQFKVFAFGNPPTLAFKKKAFAGSGAFVAVGNVDGLGAAEIIVGSGKSQGAKVSVFDSAGVFLRSFKAYSSFSGDVRVATVEREGRDVIVTGPGKGRAPELRLFDGLTVQQLDSFFAYEGNYLGGIFVAGD